MAMSCVLVTAVQGAAWKQMAVLNPGAMFGFAAFLASGALSEVTVIVRGAEAVLLKLPLPPQAAGKEAASELRDVAEAMARQEAADVAEFLARERARSVSSLPNTHFKVRKQSERAFLIKFNISKYCITASGRR